MDDRLNARLNGLGNIEVAEGSLFEPADGQFDQIASNPPFVISPATGGRLVYRDSGLPGALATWSAVRVGLPAGRREPRPRVS